jgi:hypothetical protein
MPSTKSDLDNLNQSFKKIEIAIKDLRESENNLSLITKTLKLKKNILKIDDPPLPIVA